MVIYESSRALKDVGLDEISRSLYFWIIIGMQIDGNVESATALNPIHTTIRLEVTE